MRVEWGTYQSPIGLLTLVESADGPLVVEFPPRTPRIQWAVRTRGTLPELRVEEGACDETRRWLDGYFAASLSALPAAMARRLAGAAAHFSGASRDSVGRDPIIS